MEHPAHEPDPVQLRPDDGDGEEVEQAPAAQGIDGAEWRRTVIEVLADAGEPLTFREIRERSGERLDAPAPPALQEQMESLLGLGHIDRIPNASAYVITERGRWLVEGNRVLHS